MRNEKAIIHCCVDRDVYEMLERHCEQTGQTKTTAVKRALMAYCAPVVDASRRNAAPADGDRA